MNTPVIKHTRSWTLSILCALHSPQSNLRNLARNSIFKCLFQSYGLLLWIYVTNLTLIWAEVIPTSNRHRITHKLVRHSWPNSTSTRQTHRSPNSDPCHLLSSIMIANFDCPQGIVILIHLILPLCMMTWSNTLVYSCECVCLFCFTLSSCECIFLCVLCCLMFIDMFHIQIQLMQRLDQRNEYACMDVWMSVCIRSQITTCITSTHGWEGMDLRYTCQCRLWLNLWNIRSFKLKKKRFGGRGHILRFGKVIWLYWLWHSIS
jgi:hypothetical protein